MDSFFIRRISQIVEREGLDFERSTTDGVGFAALSSEIRNLTSEVCEKLGGDPGLLTELTLSSPYFLALEKNVLVCSDELSFNRYRATTLRLYPNDDKSGLKKEAYLRYCRQFEKDCLKSGIRSDIWTSKSAEKIFGPASAPGDFFGNGSPGWKLRALAEFVRDLQLLHQPKVVRYISSYDQLMVNERLFSVSELLKSPGSEQYSALLKYIRRLLNIPSASAEQAM